MVRFWVRDGIWKGLTMLLDIFIGPSDAWVNLPLKKEIVEQNERDGKERPAIHIAYPLQPDFEKFQRACRNKELVQTKEAKRRRNVRAGDAIVDADTDTSKLAHMLAEKCVDDWRGFEASEGVPIDFTLQHFKTMLDKKLTYWLVNHIAEEVVLLEEEDDARQEEEEKNLLASS